MPKFLILGKLIIQHQSAEGALDIRYFCSPSLSASLARVSPSGACTTFRPSILAFYSQAAHPAQPCTTLRPSRAFHIPFCLFSHPILLVFPPSIQVVWGCYLIYAPVPDPLPGDLLQDDSDHQRGLGVLPCSVTGNKLVLPLCLIVILLWLTRSVCLPCEVFFSNCR